MQGRGKLSFPALLLSVITLAAAATAATPAEAQARMDRDLAAGRPLVAHLHVALADNIHQGIAPAKGQLGNGQSPRLNLYWGALYGVRTHLAKHGWKLVRRVKNPKQDGVLERVVFTTKVRRRAKWVRVYVVADAWDGRAIRQTTERFLADAGAGSAEWIKLGKRKIGAGAAAHVVAFMGHNGLLDFSIPESPRPDTARAKAAIVLSCVSENSFRERLTARAALPLLLTRDLMAPEAYTVDAALAAWFGGRSSESVRDEAAQAYCKYQGCTVGRGRRLFATTP